MFNWKVFLEVFGMLIVGIFIIASIFIVLAVIGAILSPFIGIILPIIGFIAMIAAIIAYKHPQVSIEYCE